jgi:HSP20 family protein
MGRLRDEMERLFSARPGAEFEYPPVNVTRLPDRMVVEALTPGLDRSKIDITAVGNTLTIRGEGAAAPRVDARAYHRRERETEHFVRTVRMDEHVDTERVTATYRDGILRIEVPFAPAAMPHKVEVKA